MDVKHVPFDGAQPAVTALVGGHIKAVSVSVPEVRSQVQAGNLKILGVMDTVRDPLFPDVPTFKEQGVDVVFYTWRGMGLPKGVPAAVKAKIAECYKKAFDSPDFKEFAKKASLNLAYQDVGGLRQVPRSELQGCRGGHEEPRHGQEVNQAPQEAGLGMRRGQAGLRPAHDFQGGIEFADPFARPGFLEG